MTAAAPPRAVPGIELELPLPLRHQTRWMESASRYKVGRAGRREGKTTKAFICAVAGHGPGWREGRPQLEGLLQGWDIIWLGKDYPQATIIWQTEIEPRFAGVKGVKLNRTEHTVTIIGGGTLYVRSAERKPLMGLRGRGKRVKGIICDEPAWWDLQYAWRHVLRPILLDNKGWAIFISTTNKGGDGGRDDETGNIVVPSFFNRLCQDIIDGKPGRRLEDGWEHFYGTAEDNPNIDQEEFEAWRRVEYVPGSLAESQEVYAKLLTGGAGLAFHEWRDDQHTASYEPPAGWRWFAGLDWGYRKPFAVVLFAAGPDGDILARHEMYGKEQTPYQVGYTFGQKCRGLPGRMEWIAGDSAMWAVNDGGETIAEEFQRGLSAATQPEPIPLISAPKGPGSRPARVMLLHEHLRLTPIPKGVKLPGGLVSDGTVIPPWGGPMLRFHPDCRNCIRTIPALPIDPKNTEDVDTDAEDHAYDAATYALMARVPRPEKEDLDRVPDDVHPGFEITHGKAKRKPRWDRVPEVEAASRAIEQAARQGRYITGVKWGGARPRED